MSSSDDEDDVDLNSIWEDYNKCQLEIKKEEKKEEEEEERYECVHDIDYDHVCIKCGVVFDKYNISNGCEWNNYKDDSGQYSNSTQRADLYVDENPYSTGGSIGFSTNTFIGKLQLQMNFSHKQKTYWLIGKELEHRADLINIPKIIIDKAKNYWYKYMESGKLTRASVRKGLIAACLYHSCIDYKHPITREQILEIFSCSTKTLSKGEKVLFELLNSNNLIYNNENNEFNSFVKYSNMLDLPYSFNNMCNEIYNKYKIDLQAVTPKSAIGGIIAYLVKNKLNLKKPTKTVISTTVGVCTPTLNKVILLIENLEKK